MKISLLVPASEDSYHFIPICFHPPGHPHVVGSPYSMAQTLRQGPHLVRFNYTRGNAIQYHFVAVLADPFSNFFITHLEYILRRWSSANYYTTTEILVETDNIDR